MHCEDCGKPLTLATASVEHSDLCVLCARLYGIEFDAWWKSLSPQEQYDFDNMGRGMGVFGLILGLINDFEETDQDEIED